MKYLFGLLLVVSLSGCVSYSQIFQTVSPNLKKDGKSFLTYENDTLIIKYYFWANEGILAFSIFNKLDKPIYIDWKKSSYIKNGTKIDYWVDEEIFNSTTYVSSLSGRSAIWSGLGVSISAAETSAKRSKPERLTFIAPKSLYSKSSFKLYDEKELVLSSRSPIDLMQSVYDKKKSVKTYIATFHKENSPLVFRNFLSVSTSEKFETEAYIDNEFYVSKVTELPTVEVLGPTAYFGNSWDNTYPLKMPDCFYELSISSPVHSRQH